MLTSCVMLTQGIVVDAGGLSYLLLIVGVVAEIECFADAEGYYSSRGLLLTLNVVADAGNFCSLPFADVKFIADIGGYC